MTTRSEIRFLLNGGAVALADVKPDETLLDYLRLTKRLRGSKEGCAEGDCGACTVLVGRMRGPELVYETVNACICFVGMLHGTHVVTIEHLSAAADRIAAADCVFCLGLRSSFPVAYLFHYVRSLFGAASVLFWQQHLLGE